METFVVHPDGAGPFQGVVMFQHIGGLTDALLGMARRVAASGYYCAVPSLYHRMGTVIIDPENEAPEMGPLRKAITAPMRDGRLPLQDTADLLAHMARDPLVRPGAKGAIGYCGGGKFALLAAGTYPETFTATISLFPGGLFGDGSFTAPADLVDRYAGEVYLGFAARDEHMPVETMKKFVALMEQKCRARWNAEFHADAFHGFAFPGRRVYHHDAAELTWRRTFEVFGRQLRS